MKIEVYFISVTVLMITTIIGAFKILMCKCQHQEQMQKLYRRAMISEYARIFYNSAVNH